MEKNLAKIFENCAAEFSGAALAIQGGEVLLQRAVGLANRDFAVPNTLETKFDTASITKAFTTVAVLTLVERGTLSLEDKIAEIIDLSGTQIPPEVTLFHLLTHTSGIADDADEEAGEDYSALFVEKPNYAIRTCRDFLPNFAYKPPYFAPGTNVRYNNCAFVLLGLAMEAVAGKDSREVIQDLVFTPVGMGSTGFPAKDEIEPGRAEGYFGVYNAAGERTGWKKNIYACPPTGTPDGGAYTTVQDLERFLRAVTGGHLLSQDTTAALLRPQTPFTRPHRQGIWQTGFAFEFISREGELLCMYKEGANAGVDGVTAWFPRQGITLHLLQNQDGPLWKIFHEMQDALCET